MRRRERCRFAGVGFRLARRRGESLIRLATFNRYEDTTLELITCLGPA